MGERINFIKKLLKERKYFLIFLVTILIYLGFYFSIITYFLGNFLHIFTTYTASYAYPTVILNLIIAPLLGINISLFVFKLKEIRKAGSGSAFGVFGLFTSALASGCPGCLVGAFPLFMSMFGTAASLSILPFNGLELQVGSLLLLSISITLLLRKTDLTCKIK